MKDNVVIIFAEGFEEIEAIAPVDFLRRAGLKVITAGLSSKTVIGSHNIQIITDTTVSEIKELPKAVILPGGMPGSLNLQNSKAVKSLIRKTYKAGNLVASICAATIVLNSAGVINNKNVTAYPTVKEELSESNYTGKRVEIDGNVITGKGPGVSLEFAKSIAVYLGKSKVAEELSEGMFF